MIDFYLRVQTHLMIINWVVFRDIRKRVDWICGWNVHFAKKKKKFRLFLVRKDHLSFNYSSLYMSFTELITGSFTVQSLISDLDGINAASFM